MYLVLKAIRKYVGGKSEVGIIAGVGFTLSYAFGWWPNDYEMLKGIWAVIGALTGVAFAGRIENQAGVINALKSLFTSLKKKKK